MEPLVRGPNIYFYISQPVTSQEITIDKTEHMFYTVFYQVYTNDASMVHMDIYCYLIQKMNRMVNEMNTLEKDYVINDYCSNEMKKLKVLSYPIIVTLGGVYQKDYDDFYSIAQITLLEACDSYDGSIPFEKFLQGCLYRKFQSEMKARNTDKRKANNGSYVQSMDMPLKEDEEATLADVMAADYNIEREVVEKLEGGCSKKMLLYLSRLSGIQKEVLRLMSLGYLPAEIKEALHISEKSYCDCNAAIHAYRNISVLF